LKCIAGEAWRRSVGLVMLEMKKCYIESNGEEYPAYNKKKKDCLDLLCVA